MRARSKLGVWIRSWLSLLIVFVMFAAAPIHGWALSEEDEASLFNNWPQWDTYNPFTGCGTAAPIPPNLTPSAEQTANARIIIGIAKSYNLGQQGALIGLMAGITESGLRSYANTGVPISQQNPAWLALQDPRPLGNDHDSVGIMQQRVSTGWSTYGNYTNGADAEKDRQITWQLMDSAYAAQAFFGTPPGAVLPEGLAQPGALQKGLQNIPNWQNMPPGQVAQQIQTSAFPTRYEDHRPQAQALLEQLWDNSPAVPLPIPVAAAGSEESNNICLSGGGKDVILQKIFEYAWPDYCRSGSSTCPGYASPVTKKGDQEGLDNDTLYAAAVNRSKYKGDGCYGGGVDCGAFVTIVMRESGADIEYNTGPQGNTTQQLEYLQRNSAPGGKYRLVADTEELVGGDIAIRKEGQFGGLSGHTFFYVGNITGPNGEKFNGDSASASQCGRAPMAGPKDTRSEYYWYRMTGVDAATPPPTGGGPI